MLSKIVNINLKYKSVYNISVYALTLSIILYMIYIALNVLTGFYIRLFDIAYNAISYIYIATAILMIKSDLTKQQIEVTKIVEVQKQIQEEKEQETEEEKPNKKKKEDEDENKDKEDNQRPEGNEA